MVGLRFLAAIVLQSRTQRCQVSHLELTFSTGHCADLNHGILLENIGRELGGAIVLRFGNRLDITNTSFLSRSFIIKSVYSLLFVSFA